MSILDSIRRMDAPGSMVTIKKLVDQRQQDAMTNRIWTHGPADLTGRLGTFLVTAKGNCIVGPAVDQIQISPDRKNAIVTMSTRWTIPKDDDYIGFILAFGSYYAHQWDWVAEKALEPNPLRGHRLWKGHIPCLTIEINKPEIEV